MRSAGNVRRRLRHARAEAERLRAELGVLEEQVAYTAEVADDAATRALVSQTPLADRERHDAADDLRRARAQRDEVARRIAELVAEQDRLLERLLEP